MAVSGRRKSIAFFITLGACLVALAVALNVSWILLNAREIALLVFGIVFFLLIITGVVLNTTFLIREIRRNEQHDAFINAVTHELKTPLASIRLYLETLKKRDIEGNKRQEFYDVMLADSDRLLQTVEQVLRAGQSGQRNRKLNFRKVDVGQLAHECVNLTRVRHNLAADTVTFSELVNGERPQVKADADELRAAITNLLDNAVKYSVKDVKVSVEVAALGEKKVAIRINDTGIGIPSAQLKRIFRRFYRVPGRVMARIKGTGLGLFIVRSVVENHGGKVFAESEGPGRGSRFTIELPRL
jgi:two-component system sensor histidine kinase SenX3